MIGTSTGGYQGLVEAERFPWDFAGIIAIAPDMDEAGLAMRTLWSARNLVTSGGQSLFSPQALARLHAGALQACDFADGVRDGVIGAPLSCHFDPQTIACKEQQAADCLSTEQVRAAQRIYAGPMTSTGERLAAGGLLPGSELGWMEIREDPFPDEFFRFALTENPEGGFSASRFDFDQDYKRLGLAGTMVSSNPDLRHFQEAGGKLLLIQGGNDTVEQTRVLVDYFATVQRVAGGPEATMSFARLFIVPGMNHTTGGDGAFAIDYIAALEAWAAQGVAPDLLVASHVPAWEKGARGLLAGLIAPPVGQPVTFTRPVYPYPRYARYSGHGNVNDYRSYGPATPD